MSKGTGDDRKMRAVTINMAELRARGIIMFADVCDVLDTHGLLYWLDYGTALGAAREHTIIPWDSEFDLSTFRDDIDMASPMWGELQRKGYIWTVGEYNIKIRQKDWLVGGMTIDLHMYRKTDDSALYLYGIKVRTRIGQWLRHAVNVIDVYRVRDQYRVYDFYYLYQRLLKEFQGDVAKIDGLFLQFEQGRYNHYLSFLLRHKEQTIESMAEEFTKDGRRDWLFVVPSWVKAGLSGILKKIISWCGYTYCVRVAVPIRYFQEFSGVVFCGRQCRIPADTASYLSRIYGEDWRTPKSTWMFSCDSPTYKVQERDIVADE